MDPDLINASKRPITILKGGSLFSSAESFAMIRGNHIDVTILGGMQVSERGDLANWKVPGKMVKGMGGAMDLVASADRVIVAMLHLTSDGKSKLVSACDLPLTGVRCVTRIITDLAVLDINPEGGFLLKERAHGVSVDQIKAGKNEKGTWVKYEPSMLKFFENISRFFVNINILSYEYDKFKNS